MLSSFELSKVVSERFRTESADAAADPDPAPVFLTDAILWLDCLPPPDIPGSIR
jgi:hypothetical protein